MSNSNHFEEILKQINQFVTLRKEDRPRYLNAFNDVHKYITDNLCSTDPVFGTIFNGCRLGGSYADELKVSKPDEFDLVLHLKLRKEDLIVVENSTNYISFVKILMKDQLDFLRRDVNHKELYERLRKLTNDEGYLLHSKLQSWIEGIFTRVLRDHGTRITKNGRTYNLEYRKCGPAHTIFVTVNEIKFSIDFVPAIKFGNENWPAIDRKCERFVSEKFWIAVPKPIKQVKNNSNNEKEILFQTSFVDTERDYIQKKNNLKPAIRLLKKLRDRNNITNLKSYFIKTVFLWEADRVSETFWSQHSLGYILMYMFEKLLNAVKNGITFFWYRRCNMLSPLSKEQLDSMYYQLKSLYDELVKARDSPGNQNRIYKVFLTSEEQRVLVAQGQVANPLPPPQVPANPNRDDSQPPDQNNSCAIF